MPVECNSGLQRKDIVFVFLSAAICVVFGFALDWRPCKQLSVCTTMAICPSGSVPIRFTGCSETFNECLNGPNLMESAACAEQKRWQWALMASVLSTIGLYCVVYVFHRIQCAYASETRTPVTAESVAMPVVVVNT